MSLPTTQQTREAITPLSARVLLAGMPKAGKTSLAAEWAPSTTLILDTHRGTTLLDGAHFVQPIPDWAEFAKATTAIAAGKHDFKTIVIDLIDDVYKFADAYAASKHGQVAAGAVEYGKALADAEGMFRTEVGKLIATNLGIWFLSHTESVEEDRIQRLVPRLDKRVRTYIQGAVQFVFLAETLGPRRVLHTAPTARFEAGTRVPLPEPMEMDARALYSAMAAGLKMTPPPAAVAKAAA